MMKTDLPIKRARRAVAEHRPADARIACLEALKRDPNCCEALQILGELAWEANALREAAGLFEKASLADPKDARPLAWLANSLLLMNIVIRAKAVAEQAYELGPRDGRSCDRLAQTFSMLGDYDRSLALFRQAVQLSPRRPDYWVNLGYAQQYVGDFAGAETSYRRALAIEPDFEAAYFPLISISKQTGSHNFIRKLEALFVAARGDVESSLRIGHSLAKSHEDLGEHAKAMAWLAKAKEPRRRQSPYRAERDKAMFAAARETQQEFANSDPSSTPRTVFVVGLPRSGTTLTDRILQSHPMALSLGEFEYLPQRVWVAAGGGALALTDPEVFKRASSGDLSALGRDYLQAATAVAGDNAVFVDKLPFNFLYAGLIHRALPSAKVVCVRRNPIDVCLSNYRQLFVPTSPFHDYAYDLSDIAKYYVLFDSLMAHWRGVLPADCFFELDYESLVEDQEAETRRLLTFCGLDWDERCLSFHRGGSGVSTASAHQVRSPMFTTSIGRWRAYAAELAPMMKILADAGVIGSTENEEGVPSDAR